MNFSDSLNKLFELGCQKVSFVKDKNGTPAVVADQSIITNPEGIVSVFTHQKTGGSFTTLLPAVLHDAEHCFELACELAEPPKDTIKFPA